MESLINTTIQSNTVRQLADRVHLSKDETWNIYFDAGIEYLDIFAVRVRRNRIFNKQFKRMITEVPEFGAMTLPKVLQTIRHSPSFWFWWSTEFWRICRMKDIHDSNELFFRLQFNGSLIPHFILKRIFNVKNTQCRQGTGSQCAPKITTNGATEGTVGKGNPIGLQHEYISRITIGNKQH